MKQSYPIEDQINDCSSTKDAHDMSEYELSVAEKYLALSAALEEIYALYCVMVYGSLC